MKTLIKYADLSDESRWLAKGYNYDFEISDHDKELLTKLKVIGEGEFTGLASGLLLPKMITEQVPENLIGDWTSILVYMNIIVYEEFRHGTVISKLSSDEPLDIKKVGVDFIWNKEDRTVWDAYGLLVSHCLSEVSNVLLYSSLVSRIQSPELKEIFKNIQKDESRHLSAWKELIKDLIDDDPYHKEMVLKSLKDGLNKHNAMLGKNYFKGVQETMGIFSPDSLDKMVDIKYKILNYWFGEELVSKRKIKLDYVKVLQKNR
jgi:hypothetical protein